MSDSTEKAVLVSTDDRGVMTIQLNRPHRLNALVLESVATVRKALEDAQTDDAVRAIVLTGDERSFSSGADLQAKADPENESSGSLLDDVNEIIDAAEGLVRADRRRGVRCGCRCGLLAGTCDRLRRDGLEVLLHARLHEDRPDAGRWGLCSRGGVRRSPPRDADGTDRGARLRREGAGMGTGERARRGLLAAGARSGGRCVLRRRSPAVDGATRQAINEIALPTLRSDLNREVVGQTYLLATEDAQEGAAAFREKRAPQYKGR